MIKGMKYTLEKEKILEYMKLPDIDKLRWLEEAAAFNRMALTEEEQALQRKFLDKSWKYQGKI